MTVLKPYIEEYEREQLAKDGRNLMEYIKDSFGGIDEHKSQDSMKEKFYSKSEIKEQFKKVIDELYCGFEDYWSEKHPDKKFEFRDEVVARELAEYIKINV